MNLLLGSDSKSFLDMTLEERTTALRYWEESRIPLRRVWAGLWPKLAAVFIALAVWQVVVWSGWKPDYVLPGPGPVFQRLAQDLDERHAQRAFVITTRSVAANPALGGRLTQLLGDDPEGKSLNS